MKFLIKLTFAILLITSFAFASGMSGGGGGGSVVGLADDVPIITKTSDGNATAENVLQTDGVGITVTYDTVPTPDELTLAIDQAFTPTWSGAHAFQAAITSTAAVNLGAASYITGAGTTEPYVGTVCDDAGKGCIFYETSSQKWRVNQNGAGYADLVQAGGVDLSSIPFLTTSASALLSAENVLTQGVGVLLTTAAGTTTVDFDTTAACTVGGTEDFGLTANLLDLCQGGIVFEGASANTNETVLKVVEPTHNNNVIQIPDISGALVTTGDTGTVTGTMIAAHTVTGTDIQIGTPVTGDIFRWNGTDVVRLGIGAEDDVLTVASGQPAWAANSCGAGGGAPVDATYMVASSDSTLTTEQVINDGAGIAWDTGTVPDPDIITAHVVADETTITNSDGIGNNEVAIIEAGVEAILDLSDLQGAVTDVQVPNTITINTAAAATALAANGANCSAGNYPLGVDASGAVEGCTAAAVVDHSTLVDIFDEMCTNLSGTAVQIGSSGFTVQANGGAANVQSNATISDKDHPCIMSLDTGTTTTGRTGLNWSIGPVAGTGGAMTLTWLVRFEDLSTAGEEYTLRVGFLDSLTGESTDGFFFKYDRLNLGVNWQAIVADATVLDTNDTGIVASADTWYKFEIEVNTDMSSIVYKINGSTVFTANAGNADLPEVGDKFGPSIFIFASAGTTDQKIAYVDYMSFTKVVSR